MGLASCQPHGSCEHGVPGGAQMPQLGLQQTVSALQVVMPHI
ncbi:MAG TPA: hypothetical protein VFQ61_24110 [Polyangiaceae bacterium]|nr:hypothetical protein [Polyangiaceae bacterium]